MRIAASVTLLALTLMLPTTSLHAAVRAVNLDGVAPVEAFLDDSTGLYWSDMRTLGVSTHAGALVVVANADLEGLTAWRLPTVAEFQSLYLTQGSNGVGTMLVAPFTGALTPTSYWTSEFNSRDGTFRTWSPFGDATSIALPGTLHSIWAVQAVPEPMTWLMFAAGIAALGSHRASSMRRR